MNFLGKVAIVTGGGRGIGEATARLLASHGAFVVLAARTTEEITQAAERINQGPTDTLLPYTGPRETLRDLAIAITCNASDATSCANLVQTTIERFGRIDILVNNAGIVHEPRHCVDLEDEIWEELWQSNLMGAVRLTRLVARHLINRRADGAIVNVSSVAGMRAAAWQSAYGASKAALLSLTRSSAIELGEHNIRVNAVACGLVHTRMAESVFANPRLLAKLVEKTPLGISGEPEDIAQAIVFLASDASRFMTGHTMIMDGGISL